MYKKFMYKVNRNVAKDYSRNCWSAKVYSLLIFVQNGLIIGNSIHLYS